MMWTRIQYTLDKQILQKPITDFKDWEDIRSELEADKVRNSYWVFWSSNEDETVEDVRKTEGRILEIENIVESIDGKFPVAGYYKAVILNYANSEAELEEKLELRSGRRRVAANLLNSKTKKATKRADNKRAKSLTKSGSQHNKRRLMSLGSKGQDLEVSERGKELFSVGSEDKNSNLGMKQTSEDEKKLSPVGSQDSNASNHNVKASEASTAEETETFIRIGSHPQSQAINESNHVGKSQSTQKPKKNNGKKNVESDEEEEDCSDEDDVPYVQYKELVEELRVEKERSALKEATVLMMRESILEERRKNDELKEKLEKTEQELKEYIQLNKFYQQQEIAKRSRTHSSSSHPSSSSRHSSSSHRSHSSKSSSRQSSSSVHSRSRHSKSPEHSSISVKPHTVLKQAVNPSTLKLDSVVDGESDSFMDTNDNDASDFETMNGESHSTDGQAYTNTISSTKVQKHNITVVQCETDVTREGTGGTGSGEDNYAAKQQKELERLKKLHLEDTEPAFGIIPEGFAPITHSQFKAARQQNMKNKTGVLGDSQFVINVAGMIWDPDVLAHQSAAGRENPTSDEPAKPECCRHRKQYCEELLKIRIQLEEPNTSEDSLKERANAMKIKKYVRNKIKSLSRRPKNN